MRQTERLEALAAHHEQLGKSIRMTIDALNMADGKKAETKFGETVKGALKMRASEKHSTNGHEKRAPGAVLDAAMALLDAKHPKQIADIRAALEAGGMTFKNLIPIAVSLSGARRRGFVKQTAKGYTLGRKTYTPKSIPEAAAAT